MEKFREFWLEHETGQFYDSKISEHDELYDAYNAEWISVEEKNTVHVIEKPAFDELLGIAESLRYALKEGDQFNKHKALSDFEDFKQKLGGGE